MRLAQDLDTSDLMDAVRVVLRFGGKIKRNGYTVYLVKDRLRIDLVVEEGEDEH